MFRPSGRDARSTYRIASSVSCSQAASAESGACTYFQHCIPFFCVWCFHIIEPWDHRSNKELPTNPINAMITCLAIILGLEWHMTDCSQRVSVWCWWMLSHFMIFVQILSSQFLHSVWCCITEHANICVLISHSQVYPNLSWNLQYSAGANLL